LLAGCRDAKQTTASSALVPSDLAAGGCTGPDQSFTPGQGTSLVPLATALDDWSQVTAAGDAETLYLTAGGAVVEVDVSGVAPVETELASAAAVSALLAGAGIATPPRLSGLAVLDASALLVVDHTSNTILAVDRSGSGAVVFYAGEPDESGGFADGAAQAVPGFSPARFAFAEPGGLLAIDPVDGRVFVADTGNHALRVIQQGFVSTLAGSGSAFFADGDLQAAGFDTPVGLTVTCSGTLLVTETGAAGKGGHRLRRVVLGPSSFFGQQGTVVTVAGDGTAATLEGNGPLAQLAAPRSPLSTSQEDTYWIDAQTGILRRMRGALDSVDCPLWDDCAAAVTGGGDLTPGVLHSLTQTPGGVLFVLDAGAGELRRVTPQVR
jgi:hypothetical protein